MKFEHLKASIANNSAQPPSIYMALCMVESLFMDIEKACGADGISRCPDGGEALPSKLNWLCRSVNDIYNDNKDGFQRVNPRLEANIKKLDDAKEELGRLAGVSRQLEEVQGKLKAAENELAAASANAKEYERLRPLLEAAREKLTELRGFDPQTTLQELNQLTVESKKLEIEIADLNARLELARAGHSGLLEKENALANSIAGLSANKTALEAEIDRLTDKEKLLKAEIFALDSKKKELPLEIEALEPQLISLKNAVSKKQEELATLEQERSAQEQKKKTLENTGINLTIAISALNDDIQQLEGSLARKQQDIGEKTGIKAELESSLAACAAELEALQQELPELENKEKAARQRCDADLARREALTAQLDALKEAAGQINADISKLEADKLNCETETAQLDEKLQKYRSIYDALTAEYAVKHRELDELKQKINELSTGDIETKLETYRRQQEVKIKELEAAKEQCKALEDLIEKLRQDIEATHHNRQRLEASKKQHEDALSASKELLQELSFVEDPKYREATTVLKARAALLEDARTALEKSMSAMRSVLGKCHYKDGDSSEAQFSELLNSYETHIDSLHKALMKCASSLKMEER